MGSDVGQEHQQTRDLNPPAIINGRTFAQFFEWTRYKRERKDLWV
jgi:hypothetical protein